MRMRQHTCLLHSTRLHRAPLPGDLELLHYCGNPVCHLAVNSALCARRGTFLESLQFHWPKVEPHICPVIFQTSNTPLYFYAHLPSAERATSTVEQ